MGKRHRRYGWVIAAVSLAAAIGVGSQPPAEPPANQPPKEPAPTGPTGPASPAPTGPTGPTIPAPAPPTAPPAAPAPAPAAPGVQPSTDPKELREAVVLLKDGQRYKGLLVSRDDEKVVLRISGINTPIPTSQIDRVQVLAPVLVQYKSMRETIDDNDTERLLMLVEWLRLRSQWDPALAELDHILKVQPDNFEAKKMRTLVASQKKLAEAAANPKPVHPPTGPATKPGAPAAEADAFPVLGERDINLIKVYEVDLNDPPRMLIDRRTIERLLTEHAGDQAIPNTPEGREAMYRMPPAKILEAMFKVQARNLYDQVQVRDHPRAMRLFRDEVQTGWIVNNCATSRCHGGSEAGRLRLCNKRPGTDAAVYTNFLILERYRMSDGRALINYDEPAKSPLLEMALPRDPSRTSHPVVPAAEGHGDLWRPFFRSASDAKFAKAEEWIKALYRPRPDYPIQYTPPAPLAAQPAPAPAPR